MVHREARALKESSILITRHGELLQRCLQHGHRPRQPRPQRGNSRQRPLLTVDEVVTPQMVNCTIFARYVEPAFATQVISPPA